MRRIMLYFPGSSRDSYGVSERRNGGKTSGHEASQQATTLLQRFPQKVRNYT